jgi:hypothetical protein
MVGKAGMPPLFLAHLTLRSLYSLNLDTLCLIEAIKPKSGGMPTFLTCKLMLLDSLSYLAASPAELPAPYHASLRYLNDQVPIAIQLSLSPRRNQSR